MSDTRREPYLREYARSSGVSTIFGNMHADPIDLDRATRDVHWVGVRKGVGPIDTSGTCRSYQPNRRICTRNANRTGCLRNRNKVTSKNFCHFDVNGNGHDGELAALVFIASRVDRPGISKRFGVGLTRKHPMQRIGETPDKFRLVLNCFSIPGRPQRVDDFALPFAVLIQFDADHPLAARFTLPIAV